MVVRKQNLLDAFREAAPEGRKASELAQPPSTPAGGPFAASTRTSPTPVAAPRPAPPPPKPPDPAAGDFEMPEMPSMLRQAAADRTLRAVVLVTGLVALGAFLIGRLSGGGEEGADPAPEVSSGPGRIERGPGAAPPAGADLAEKNRAAAMMGSADDKAFMDPANDYTICLIQYDSSPANLERAHATAEHLRRKEGLPIVGPISMGNVLVLAAGHTPRVADLDRLLQHVKTLGGPPPQEQSRPFASAYVVNIDSVVKRD